MYYYKFIKAVLIILILVLSTNFDFIDSIKGSVLLITLIQSVGISSEPYAYVSILELALL